MAHPISYCQAVYGPDAPQQFLRIARQYRVEFDDVVQTAVEIYLENINKFNPDIADLAAFLYSRLLWKFYRSTYGVLKFVVSLEHEQDIVDGTSLKSQIEQLASPAPDEPDRYNFAELNNPELKEMYALAEAISGKSYPEIAIDWKKSVRRVRQILEEKMQRAKEINSQVNIHAPKKRRSPPTK